MKSLVKIKVLRVSTNLLMIISFIFMAFSLDNIIIKITALPITIWLLFVSFRVLKEKSLNLHLDKMSQIEFDGILYDHKNYSYSQNRFILGLTIIPILIIEDKQEFIITCNEDVVHKFNVSTFSKEDRYQLDKAEKSNRKHKKETLLD